MRVCIDFDGVLHDGANPVPGRRMGAPIDGALEAVKLLARNHELIVLTAQQRHDHIVAWLDYYGFPPLPVTNVKPLADVYLDDHAVRFVDWDDAFAAIDTIARRRTCRTR